MSSRAFPANNPGNPPAPFRSFPAGAIVFFLVALLSRRSSTPEPAGQLSTSRSTQTITPVCGGEYRTRAGQPRTCTKEPNHSEPCGWTRRVVEMRCTETARRNNGGRRTFVASRSVTWSKFERGAKARAMAQLENEPWTDRRGRELRIWCRVVLVEDAARLGFETPQSETVAQNGTREVGRENNARATVRGSRAVPAQTQASQPEPAQTQPEPVHSQPEPAQDPSVPEGLASIAADAAATAETVRQARQRPTPSWVASFSRGEAATREREAAIAAREAAREERAREAEAVREERSAYVPQPEGEDPSVIRFRLLDLEDGPAPQPEPEEPEDAPARVPLID